MEILSISQKTLDSACCPWHFKGDSLVLRVPTCGLLCEKMCFRCPATQGLGTKFSATELAHSVLALLDRLNKGVKVLSIAGGNLFAQDVAEYQAFIELLEQARVQTTIWTPGDFEFILNRNPDLTRLVWNYRMPSTGAQERMRTQFFAIRLGFTKKDFVRLECNTDADVMEAAHLANLNLATFPLQNICFCSSPHYHGQLPFRDAMRNAISDVVDVNKIVISTNCEHQLTSCSI